MNAVLSDLHESCETIGSGYVAVVQLSDGCEYPVAHLEPLDANLWRLVVDLDRVEVRTSTPPAELLIDSSQVVQVRYVEPWTSAWPNRGAPTRIPIRGRSE